jgi:hypothetical protein
MSRRYLAIGSVGAASAAVAALLLVAAVGNAGNSKFQFKASAGPSALTTGQQGLVFAKFTPGPGGGTATHTVITFTFPTTGAVSGWTADPATSSDCKPSGANAIVCAVGNVHRGDTVKRFVTVTAGSTTGDVSGITAEVTFDNGSSGAKGGGATNVPAQQVPLTIVDGSTADGTCQAGGATVQTTAVGGYVRQSTALSFGNADPSLQLPCTWGTVSVINQQRGPQGAPEISSAGGPTFDAPSTLTLTFATLPVPVSQFVLMENEHFDPANPSVGWFPVPTCPTATTLPADPNVDACLVGHVQGWKPPFTATLLYRGTASSADPWFN